MYDRFMEAVAEDVEDLVAEVAGHLNAQHARLVRITAAAEHDGSWFGVGFLSITHWLTLRAGVAPGHANQIVTIARRVDELPVLMAAFERGELSLDQVYEVAAKAPAWADRQLTEFALVATVRQLRRMIRDENFDGDPDQPEPEAKSSHRAFSPGWDEHGRLQLSGSVDTEQGTVVDAALGEARDALFHAGHTDVTWADALAEIARRSLAGVACDRRERFRTNMHIHTDTGAAQLGNGVTVPPAIRDYLLCDGEIRPVWERDNIPFGVGRTQRTVPDRTRRIIEHRDQGCRVPGCGAQLVHIHHIVPWSEGGLTETCNLLSLCPRHHKLHHLGRLRISGNADLIDGVVFSDESDRRLEHHPRPRPPSAPPPPPAEPYRHPSGERLQPKWTGLGWAHPNALRRRREQTIRHHELMNRPTPDAPTPRRRTLTSGPNAVQQRRLGAAVT